MPNHFSALFRLEDRGLLVHNERRATCLGQTRRGESLWDFAGMFDKPRSSVPDFEVLVENYYRQLYQFAMSLTHAEAQACDLTQQTFYIWARKGHQLRDASKVKTWLFTTLHREFLKTRRRQVRFPEQELDGAELPAIDPAMINHLDAKDVLAALGQVNELYQAPVALFYLDELSYKEIAEVLDVPIGTVQSRIARGKAKLQQLLFGKDVRG
jgi:RNA polymerase sigma-70 factor (ECF subfamily)